MLRRVVTATNCCFFQAAAASRFATTTTTGPPPQDPPPRQAGSFQQRLQQIPGQGFVMFPQKYLEDMEGCTIHPRPGDPSVAPVHYLTHDESKTQFWFRQVGEAEWHISEKREGDGTSDGEVLMEGEQCDAYVSLLRRARALRGTVEDKIRQFSKAVLAMSVNHCYLRLENTDRRHKGLYSPEHFVAVGHDKARAALENDAHIIAVTGPAGVGKTAFAQETLPRAIGQHFKDKAGALPVIACSRVSSRSDTAKESVGHLREEFGKVFKLFGFDASTVKEEELRFGTAVGIIDEMPADANDVELDVYLEQFKKDTPWAKYHVLVVAGTSLSHHSGLPRPDTTVDRVAKLRLAAWQESEVVDFVGNVGAAKNSSAREAGRFLAQLALGVTPDFVPTELRGEVKTLLKNRSCAHLGHSMLHNARVCRFVADSLLEAPLLLRALTRFSQDAATPAIKLEPSDGRTVEAIAADIKAVTGLSTVDFIRHHLARLEAVAAAVIDRCVSKFFELNGVSMASRPELLNVAKAIFAVVNKQQHVATDDDWKRFQAAYGKAHAAVSYGLLALDVSPGDCVSLKPTSAGLYVALMSAGFIVPLHATFVHEFTFERVAALAAVTQFNIDAIVAANGGVGQASADEFPAAAGTHFDERAFPEHALVFAVSKNSSSDARFNNLHLQMKSLKKESATTQLVLDVFDELRKSRMFEPVSAPRIMVFVCEHTDVLLGQLQVVDGSCPRGRLNASDANGCVQLKLKPDGEVRCNKKNNEECFFPTALAGLTNVDVYVMYGKQLEHWLPLLGRVQLQKQNRGGKD